MLRLSVYADKHHQSFAPINIIHHVEMRCTDVTQATTHAWVENELEEEYRGVDFDQGCRPAPVIGLCRAYFERWYFDVSAGSCERFVYGGCGGNANNYKSQRECEVACLPDAIDLLQQRFGKQEGLVHDHMRTLVDIHKIPPQGNARGLCPLYDSLQVHIRGLEHWVRARNPIAICSTRSSYEHSRGHVTGGQPEGVVGGHRNAPAATGASPESSTENVHLRALRTLLEFIRVGVESRGRTSEEQEDDFDEPYELWCAKLAQLGTAIVPVEAAESGNQRHRRIKVTKPQSCAGRCPAAFTGTIDTSLPGVSYFDVVEKLGKREESPYRFLRRLRGGNTVAI
ncbi:hypothetical protein HPB47_007914 [Ixodes persulcatus]|uniref:Uncharacterized protein n=1 Tax=Ixodes persulcatus TaxID=34615 RepID=A0AC60P6J8_IXOPE|nr:hypothetical protein HPB47_007914 [Ixodes persulcatus]